MDLGQVLTDYVVKRHEERDGDYKLHPSGESTCFRQAMYASRGTPRTDPADPRSKRIMFLGTSIHELVQAAAAEAAEAAGLTVETEVEVDYGILTGSSDLLVQDGDTWTVHEIKSISTAGFRYVQRAPKPEHVRQAGWYVMGLSRQQPKRTVDGAVITYFDRNDMRSVAHEVDYSMEDFQAYEERMLEAEEIYLPIESTMLPPRPPETETKRGFWLCDYCPWRTRCYTQDTRTRRID